MSLDLARMVSLSTMGTPLSHRNAPTTFPLVFARASRYLTRSLGDMCGYRVEEKYSWPTCEMHYELALSEHDFYDWVWESTYKPHGPVHVWIGGSVDCEKTYRRLTELIGSDDATTLAFLAFFTRKHYYRFGLWKCEGTSSMSQDPDEVR